MDLFKSSFSSLLLLCSRSAHVTGDLKLSAATDNSLRAGIDEATGKLSVRMSQKLPLVSGTHVGFLCTHAAASHRFLFTWAGAHWWLPVAFVRNCREEIFLHPFHLDSFLPPCFLEWPQLCCRCVILPSCFSLSTAAKISPAQVQILSICLKEEQRRGVQKYP